MAARCHTHFTVAALLTEGREPCPTDDCLFCKILAGEIPADLIYESDTAVAFRDINPQAPTHALIIPRKHIATINDIGDGRPGAHWQSVLRPRREIAAAGRHCRGRLSRGYELQRRRRAIASFTFTCTCWAAERLDWPPG